MKYLEETNARRVKVGPTRNGVVMSCVNRLTDQVTAADNLGNFFYFMNQKSSSLLDSFDRAGQNLNVLV